MISDRIHNMMTFRLLFGTQGDRYEPEEAGPLLRGLRNLDDDSARIVLQWWAERARVELDKQVN
jgi:hypothetical protein